MTEKTPTQLLIEARVGCSIEQYVEKKTADGFSIPRIALAIETEAKIGVTPECLRGWIKKAGGRTRIEFPSRETVAV